MRQLFCDCKTDEEKANFFLSGRAVETGIIAPAVSNDVAMAYHRCAEFQKEIDALRAKITDMEKQEPVRWGCTVLQSDGSWKEEIGIEEPPKDYYSIRNAFPLYALPGVQGEEK